VYATEGFEEADPFVTSRHDYPTESTITVRAGGCGLELRWDVLEGRSTTWESCSGGELRRELELHTFFGTEDRRDYRCEPGARAPAAASAPGESWTNRCATDTTTETAVATVVALEPVSVDGRPVEALHVREQVTLSGLTDGEGVREWWLRPSDGLVLRHAYRNESVTGTAIGDVPYREQYELVLTSLEPRR
jgi:hypothetical protein